MQKLDNEKDVVATQEARCIIESKVPKKILCSTCGTVSRQVQYKTVYNLIKPELRSFLQEVQYYFCKDAFCKTVYFSNEDVYRFTVNDVTVKVFAKDFSENVPVCYCFGWTRYRIKWEIEETRQSTAAQEIAHEIKAKRCQCELNNPKGECCLGDVNIFVNKLLSET